MLCEETYPGANRLNNVKARTNWRMTVKNVMSAVLAIATLVGVAGQALAANSNEINANNTKRWYDQMDRENRGGSSGG
jgi:hypothetical protein